MTDPRPGVVLRLYVAGSAPNSVRAIANATRFCSENFDADHCVFEIVDLLNEPLRGLADGILVTPTLIRMSPLPVRKVVGNLSDEAQLLLALRPG